VFHLVEKRMTDRQHPLAEQGLSELREQLLRMGRLAEAILEKSLRAFGDRDEVLASQIQGDDLAIDRLDVAIDRSVLGFLALHSPVANDLRQVIAIKTAALGLERVGDLARNIAECTLQLTAAEPVPVPQVLAILASESQRMLGNALTAFADGDAERARSVLAADDRIDADEDRVINEAIDSIGKDPEIARQAVQIILIAKSLERVGDLATNIAEDVIMMAESVNLKHAGKIGDG